MDPQDQQQEARYVILTEDILGNPELSSNDKIVLARASGFPEFFESAEETGKFLGMNERTVRRSKQRLLELGYLIELRNTGHGKRYAVDIHRTLQRADSLTGQIVLSDRTNDTRPDKSGHQTGQKWSSDRTKVVTENKKRLKREETIVAQAPEDETDDEQLKEDESPKRYGNADINEILDLWEEATGFSHHSEKRERFAANNLLRKYGLEATKALVRRVEVAKRSDDQFAPQIAKPSQLMGKYEKLTAPKMWEERTAKREEAERANSNTPDFRKLYANPDAPHYYHDCRPSTPEEKAEVHRKAEEIKKKLDWYVPKDQRKEGC